MAIVFANVGARASRDANQQAMGCVQFGASVSITFGAASASAQLPVDSLGRLYPAYLITATATCWWNINTAGDAAVAGAANNYIAALQQTPLAFATPPNFVAGATAQISAIQDAAGGKLCITGIF